MIRFQREKTHRLLDLYRSILKDAGTSADNKFTSIALTNFIAGAAVGCTTLVIIYPLDIAHTHLAADIGQTDARQFKGIQHFIQTIYKKNDIRGIYRGLPASLHGMLPATIRLASDSPAPCLAGASRRRWQRREHLQLRAWSIPSASLTASGGDGEMGWQHVAG
ncbi:ADP/ATP translocase 2 [Hordeum vulgare]|nr:ADP/ATP translocase 2 [Hordeum vulgare]